jgi:diguanylate cyclase (GGDEF)-like protein
VSDHLRVCVIDDNEDSTLALCEGLRQHGYEAVPAFTGAEGLEVCTSSPVDLVLLDIRLPDVDGLEVCRQLKTDANTRDILVIFVSVKGSKEDILEGYRLGAVDYITKPYNLPMVMVRVEAAIRKRGLGEQTQEQADPLGDPAYTDQLTGLRNRRFLLERLQEEVDKSNRFDYPVSCVAFDIDEVVPLDEELGPVSLDDLLVEIGMTLRNYSRSYDIVSRFDGTMFAAVLPHAPREQAEMYAEKIREEIEATTFSDPSFPTQIQVRSGVASCPGGADSTADELLGEAMRGLLRARV